MKCSGFRNGWAGVLKGDYFPLTRERVSGILHLGGTILGTSRTNPTDEQLDTLVEAHQEHGSVRARRHRRR